MDNQNHPTPDHAEQGRDAIDRAVRMLATNGIHRADTLVILGSGWREAADRLGEPLQTILLETVPGFARPTVAGHGGEMRLHRIAGRDVLVLLGRTHLYEGRGVDAVVHPVRVAARLGVRTMILTNGCGSTRAEWGPGTIVLLADHINLTGVSPLTGPEFVDMTDAYSPALRALAHRVESRLAEGVYAQFRGPQYETPAEVRMAARAGADLVGMSTTLETIAARAAGMEVLGVSLVTNTAAGVNAGKLSHTEVLDVGRETAPRLGFLLAGILESS